MDGEKKKDVEQLAAAIRKRSRRLIEESQKSRARIADKYGLDPASRRQSWRFADFFKCCGGERDEQTVLTDADVERKYKYLPLK